MTTVVVGAPALLERYLPELERSTATELRLLQQLHEQLIRQRQAVASGVAEVINETVHDAGRVLRTLEEARQRRRQLCQLLLDDPDLAPAALPAALGLSPDAPLAGSVRELVAYADVVARTIAVNRRLLNSAMRADRELVRVLQGEPASAPVYQRAAPPPARGIVLNRSI